MFKYPLNKNSIGIILRTLRKKYGLSQTELAKKVSLSKSSISRIENGLKYPDENELSVFLQKAPYKIGDYLSYVDAINVLSSIKNDTGKTSKNDTITKRAFNKKDSKESIIQLLKKYFENKPIKEAYLFGSIARNEHSSLSDIDLYLSFPDEYKITIFDLGKMQAEINQLTGRDVDLVLSGSEYGFIKNNISKEKILIYG